MVVKRVRNKPDTIAAFPTVSSPDLHVHPSAMTGREYLATGSLASILAMRMFGLFMIMPVFSLYAKTLPGGDNALWVGVAMGIYGLVQATFHIPYGWLSDRWGRKPVIIGGLLIFALGGVIAAFAQNVAGVAVGRAIQGLGAISSVLMASIVDSTHPAHHTKTMAITGVFIGVAFALAIVVGPTVYAWIGMQGLFLSLSGSAIVAIGIVLRVLPSPGASCAETAISTSFAGILRQAGLMRANVGVLILHATQVALFITVPALLVAAGLPLAKHWKMYLPVMGLSFVLMMPAMIFAEARGKMKTIMLFAVVCLLFGQLLLAMLTPKLGLLCLTLLLYFLGFNVLEAALPSLVAKLAPVERRGAAMGVYNTMKALGYFIGGAGAGWLLKCNGYVAVFWGCTTLLVVWLIVVTSMERLPRINRSNRTKK